MTMKWYNIGARSEKLRAFNFILGGRGIGKTYSSIDYIISSGKKFLYLRNTKTQMDESATVFGNPFKRWGADHGRDIFMTAEKNHYMIYERIDEDPVLIGYGAALSTFGSLRGVDLSDVEIVLFDEFIESRTLSFKQFDTFANLYETINRNRELLGRPPLQVLLLSNSQKLGNDILSGFGCIGIIERMIKNSQTMFIDRDMMIELCFSDVSEEKKNTGLYRLTSGSSFYDEAIQNKFANDSFAGIGKKPISEFIPVCGIDELFIYRHKNDGRIYVSRSPSNRVPTFTTRDTLAPFMLQFGVWLKVSLASGNMLFEDFKTKYTITDILN